MKSRVGRRASQASKSVRTILFVSLTLTISAAAAGLFYFIAMTGAMADDAVGRASRTKKKSFAVKLEPRLPYSHPERIIVQGRTSEIRGVAGFHDRLFAATAAGLLEFSEDGAVIRSYTVLDGLPESDLTALAVFEQRLYIGTRAAGIVSFDGARFFAHQTEESITNSISLLSSGRESLFIGTTTKGLFEFDGNKMIPVEIENKPIQFPTTLELSDDLVAIGTFDTGAFFSHRGRWRHFDSAQGLHSNRVTGLAIKDGFIFAATDLGLSRIDINSLADDSAGFEKLFTSAGISGLRAVADRVLFGFENGRIASVGADGRNAAFVDAAVGRGARIGIVGGEIFVFGESGIGRVKTDGADVAVSAFYVEPPDEIDIAAVSSLAVTAGGRIFAGGFRGGIVELGSDLRQRSTIERSEAREINSISDAEGRLFVGAMNGAFEISIADGMSTSLRNTTTESAQTNLVRRIRANGKVLTAIATNVGLTVVSGRSMRHFSTLNGLPSNSVFSFADTGDSLVAATMSGLAVIRHDRVQLVANSANSELPHNWVTALVEHRGRIVGGTYGGGLFSTSGNGELAAIETPAGARFINPNAIFSDGEYLYAGTTDGLLILGDPAKAPAIHQATLPSRMVLTVTADREYVYAGTISGVVRIQKDALFDL